MIMEPEWDIERIENYLRGRLPTEEAQRLQTAMQRDPALRQEVEAYQVLLDGLATLQTQELSKRMEDWENEHRTADDTEWITWYLEGRLAPEGERQIEARIAKDPAFAEEVAAYRQLLEGFDVAADQQFRQQMQSWETGSGEEKAPPRLRAASRRRWLQYAAAAAVALLITNISIYYYAQSNYTGPAITSNFYQAPLSNQTLGGEAAPPTALENRFEYAHQQLQEESYTAAFMAFDSLIRAVPQAQLDDFNKTLLLEQAEWNRLLAAIGMDNPPIDPKAEARRISQQPGHEFAEPAAKVEQRLGSFLHRWVD